MDRPDPLRQMQQINAPEQRQQPQNQQGDKDRAHYIQNETHAGHLRDGDVAGTEYNSVRRRGHQQHVHADPVGY
jgi:hypothetical protein